MAEYAFGANILENLTTGMYQDSKVIYREYIQNACDQIDKAEQLGILRARDLKSKYPDLGQGVVNIWLEPDTRRIVIEDNATGIKAQDFQRTLGNIADSDKKMGVDKGFRGIGRLCGLAYCKRLIFTSRWVGEDIVSVMTCDALKMRNMINESNSKVQKHSAVDVLNAMVEFSTRSAVQSDPSHFFRVELIDINDENEELFGGNDENNLEQLMDYLSFVSPVPYQANFIYRSDIYSHVKELGVRLDEYAIKINGEQIFKKYKTHLKTGNGQDEVFGVEFHEFYSDDNNELLAWMWFGKTSFKASIKEEEISRGLRLRKENIQIGENDTLRDMFTRESSKRGNGYFIGEIFAAARELIPNSQRSYFNENPVRITFEHKLKDYFNNTLYHIYYEGSDVNASIKKLTSYAEKAAEFENKKESDSFLSTDDFEREQKELETKRQEAEKAKKNLEKKKTDGRSILTRQIIERRSDEISKLPIDSALDISSNITNDDKEIECKAVERKDYKPKKKFLVDTLFPNANRGERKLISETLDKVFAIIQKATDKKTSDIIIAKIKEELK